MRLFGKYRVRGAAGTEHRTAIDRGEFLLRQKRGERARLALAFWRQPNTWQTTIQQLVWIVGFAMSSDPDRRAHVESVDDDLRHRIEDANHKASGQDGGRDAV